MFSQGSRYERVRTRSTRTGTGTSAPTSSRRSAAAPTQQEYEFLEHDRLDLLAFASSVTRAVLADLRRANTLEPESIEVVGRRLLRWW
jgi:hypothetical protein